MHTHAIAHMDPKKVFGVAWGCTPTPKKLFSQSEIKARHAVEGSEPKRFGTKAAVSGSEAQSAVVAAGLAAATALPQQALAVRAASEDDEALVVQGCGGRGGGLVWGGWGEGFPEPRRASTCGLWRCWLCRSSRSPGPSSTSGNLWVLRRFFVRSFPKIRLGWRKVSCKTWGVFKAPQEEARIFWVAFSWI